MLEKQEFQYQLIVPIAEPVLETVKSPNTGLTKDSVLIDEPACETVTNPGTGLRAKGGVLIDKPPP